MKAENDLDVTTPNVSTQDSNSKKPRKSKGEYIILSLNMVDVGDRMIIVVKLKHLETGKIIFRTPEEIVEDHKFAAKLSTRDLIQVCYLAGFHQTVH